MEDAKMHIDPQLLGEEEQVGEEGQVRGLSREPSEEVSEIDRAGRLGYNPQLPGTYDPQLEYDRRRNKEKLRSRFEQIFEKYERDFDGVGDEIDLQTGEIIVDNGHVKHMRHEADPGGSESTSLAQDLMENTEPDGDLGSSAESANDEHSEGDDDEASASGDTNLGDFSQQYQAAESPPSSFEAEGSVGDIYHKSPLDSANRNRPLSHGTGSDELRARQGDRISGLQHETPRTLDDGGSDVVPENVSEQVPDFRESMLALQSKYKDGEEVDLSDIQTISTNIAQQIAAFISRGSEQTSKDRGWSFPELPGDLSKGRRLRSPSPSPLPTSAASSPCQESLWAPMRHPRPRKRRRLTQATSELLAQDGDESSLFPVAHEGDQQAVYDRRPAGFKVCSNCDSVETSTWRHGPDGNLCNPCGMYYYRYGLLRPMEDSDNDTDLDMDESTSGYAEDTPPPIGTIGARCARFNLEEDAEVIKLKEIDELSWEKIATRFEGRSAYALQCRYSKKLHGRRCEAREILICQGFELIEMEDDSVAFARRIEGWTRAEDDLLIRLLEDDAGDSDMIAASFPGRAVEAMDRYNELALRCLDGKDVRRKPKKKAGRRERLHERLGQKYSTEEDELIVKLREVDKLKWADLADRFPGRNAVSLQKRYVRDLRKQPEQTEKYNESSGEATVLEIPAHEPVNVDSTVVDQSRGQDCLRNVRYTVEEDELLVYLRDVKQMRWEDIEPMVPGRNRLSLFNRWSYIQMKQPSRKLHYKGREDESMLDPELDPVTTQFRREFHDGDVDTSISGLNGTEADERPGVPLENELCAEVSDSGLDPAKGKKTQTSAQISTTSLSTTTSSIEAAYTKGLNVQTPASTSSAPRSRWSRYEADMLESLRAQGISWIDIAKRLPGRTENSVKAYHSKWVSTKRSSLPLMDSLTAQRSETHLLRRALDNSLLRHSESSVPASNPNSTLQDRTTDGASDGVLSASGSELLTQSHEQLPAPNSELSNATTKDKLEPTTECGSDVVYQGTEQSAVPMQTNSSKSPDPKVPQQSPAMTPNGQEQTAVYPESPLQSARGSRPYLDTSPFLTASYITPARFNSQAHPYYIAPPALMYIPPDAEQPLQSRSPVAHHTKSTASIQEPEAVASEHAMDSAKSLLVHSTSPTQNVHTTDLGVDESRADKNTEAETQTSAPCWVDLNTTALKSNLPHPMAATAIYRYYEMNFPSAISDRHDWKNRVSATLHNMPQFERVYEDRKLLWALISEEKATERLAQPGKRRGMPPGNGASPEQRMVQGPKKRSRPPKRRADAAVAGDDGDEVSGTAQDEASSKVTNPTLDNTERHMPDQDAKQAPVASTQTISFNASQDPEISDGSLRTQDGSSRAEEPLNDHSSDPTSTLQQVPSSKSRVSTTKTPANVSVESATPGTGHSTLFGQLQQHVSSALRFASPWAGLPASTPTNVAPPHRTKKTICTDVQSAPKASSVDASGSAKPVFHKRMLRSSMASSVAPIDGAKRTLHKSMPRALRASSVVPVGSTKRVVHTPMGNADSSEDELAL